MFRHIMNGEVIHVSPVIGKAAVEFRCHDKYRLIGRRRLECISGRWNGNIPFCKSKFHLSPDCCVGRGSQFPTRN